MIKFHTQDGDLFTGQADGRPFDLIHGFTQIRVTFVDPIGKKDKDQSNIELKDQITNKFKHCYGRQGRDTQEHSLCDE